MQNTTSNKVTRNEIAIWTDLEDRVAFLCVNQDLLFEADGVGKVVWDFLREAHSLDEIVEHVRSVYRVDRDRCEADIRSFVARLAENDLVRVCDVAPAA